MSKVSDYFKGVKLVDPEHHYFLNGERLYWLSSTGFKAQFVEKFREDYFVAHAIFKRLGYEVGSDRKYALKDHIYIFTNEKNYHYKDILEGYPKEAEKIHKEWKEKSDRGKEKGNYVHDFLELCAIHKGRPPKFNVKKAYLPFIKGAAKYWRESLNDNYLFEPEVKVYDKDLELIGTTDGILHIDPKKKIIDIIDYKSDEDFTLFNRWSNLLGPFSSFDACSLNEYSIQVNTYRKLIELNSPFRVRKIKLVNILPNTYEVHEVPRMESNMQEALKIRKAFLMGGKALKAS